MTNDLLLEIGTEEIPARFVPNALESMATLLKNAMEENRIVFKGIRTFGTPRRLVLSAEAMDEKQADTVLETIGPSKRAAFDENGNPTKAAEGFAKSQGVKIKDLKIIKTEKGDYICAKKQVTGRKTKDILQEALPKIITGIQFAKSMRWGNVDTTFARPIHWIVALFGKDVVPFNIEDIKAGAVSYGHRFMKSGPFKVAGLKDYLKKTRAAYVIARGKKKAHRR